MGDGTMGTIRLLGLEAIGRHGVLPSEREQGQPFVVDVSVEVPMPVDDDLGQTVDYSALATEVVGIVEGRPVDLIETLAAMIADRVLEDSRIRTVEVTVHKPAAPIAADFRDVSVTISRSNHE
ncbi:hypothetical protein GCM10009785_24670 [Brooklawnia cerclae]|uniref:7,8-dihydroneopterin aldolase n=1 Tax=Brooklawnia cerclae TaxID=349934 RepID=A0ABX0SC12_9ACTN|nr:dihydroneopterin aldolase [Brooklawnia cerclae]NIH55570.1 dihydroneopterin aldolase [Brooklawnia cerclae]